MKTNALRFVLCIVVASVTQLCGQTYSFTSLAGMSGYAGNIDGTGGISRFNTPAAVAVDAAGNVYVADSGNQTIRKITPAGVVTTLAGLSGSAGSADGAGNQARFAQPTGVAVDGAGNVYVADNDNHTVRKITPAGVVSTLAGQAGAVGSVDGAGSVARFYYPSGVAADSAGNVYVADYLNCTIRKITPAGAVTTLAGLAGSAGSDDGSGSAARFNFPTAVAVDGTGNVFVGDCYNSTVRKITPAGVVSTLAGVAGVTGSADGTGGTARFNWTRGVSVDGGGNVYVADYNSHTVRKISSTGTVSTVAGLAGTLGSNDGTGGSARFKNPYGVAVDAAGNVFVADGGNHTIRKVTPAGIVATFAGLAGNAGSTDGKGSPGLFNNPYSVAMDIAGNVFVADTGNHTIRKITPAGGVSTLAGQPGVSGSADGTGSAARFSSPFAVAVDSVSNVYVADTGNWTIRKITPVGVVSTLAGLAGYSGSSDGAGSVARFGSPQGVAVDGGGNLFVADSSNYTIRKITPAGVVSTLAGLAGQGGGHGWSDKRFTLQLPNRRGGGRCGQRFYRGPKQLHDPQNPVGRCCHHRRRDDRPIGQRRWDRQRSPV